MVQIDTFSPFPQLGGKFRLSKIIKVKYKNMTFYSVLSIYEVCINNSSHILPFFTSEVSLIPA